MRGAGKLKLVFLHFCFFGGAFFFREIFVKLGCIGIKVVFIDVYNTILCIKEYVKNKCRPKKLAGLNK